MSEKIKITEEQYQKAISAKDSAQQTINEFHKQRAEAFAEAFKDRMKNNPIFAEKELTFSATTLCPCGYGLAYPKYCGMHVFYDVK